MARAIASDFLQVFKYKVTAGATQGGDAPFGGAFTTATNPELTLENVEYKDSGMKYRQKFPGIPTVNDLSLTRGVVQNRTELWDWINGAVNGEEFRIDLTVEHQDRSDATKYTYTLKNAFPIRVKLGSDFDANASDVSVEEIDIAYEEFEVEAG